MEENNQNPDNRNDHYTIRIRKRTVWPTLAIIAFWFLWSQWGEIADLFEALLVSIGL